MNPIKERDKSYKRKSYLNKSCHAEAVDHLSESKKFINKMERLLHLYIVIYMQLHCKNCISNIF